MKIQLIFSSPLLIGNKKHSSNFIESDDVIKGSVVRAAFAKIILKNCTEKDKKTFKNKLNWVFFRDTDGCKNCRYKGVCKSFSEMRFSYFYPKDTEVIPLSAKVCKNDAKHGFYDDLISIMDRCKCGGRLEFTTGLRTSGKVKIPYKVKKSLSIKNGINPYTKTSKDGLLYSIETVVGTSENNGLSEIVYEGSITGAQKEDLEIFRNLRVGGDTTVGLGKCIIICKEDNRGSNLSYTLIKRFSEKYKEKWNKEETGINYLAVKFIGDAILNFDFDGSYKTTDELKDIWERALELDNEVHVDKVYTEIEDYRGYDNSISGINKRENAVSIVKKGTVIVFSSEKSLEELKCYFENKRFFGGETINGFGEFQIYLGGMEDD